jgi:PrtD family type I secretion system ABC transporter
MLQRNPAGSELKDALHAYRTAFLGTGLISAVINVLYLTGSFFMLEVYDRVLPSRSLPTLVGLVVIAALLYAFQGALDVARGRLLIRIGVGLDEFLSERVYSVLLAMPLRARISGDGLQPLRDLDQIRAFLSGGGPMALFDMPWMPVYLAICFGFHFWIGVAALCGALILITLTIMTEVLSRAPSREASMLGAQRNGLAEASRRNAEVIRAMGMGSRVASSWRDINQRYMATQRHAADVAGGLGAVSKVLRMLLQSAVLAVGAYLVLQQETTSGIIIASSILTARALAPVEVAIANWRGFLSARQSWSRLRELLRSLPQQAEPIELAAPCADIAVENISVVPPGGRLVVVQDVALALKSGQGLGVIGPSGSGKSSLVRALVGVWPVLRGKVRIDGAALEQWDVEKLGRHIGYLPQEVELFAGTVAQNIARFEAGASADDIIEAAKAADVHQLILHFPDGYETQIGEGGTSLSAGQRQRVALARALYKAPFLVVLDEPNSNLDQDGEAALGKAIQGVRARGGIVILVAHRPSMLANIDMLLVMAEGGRVRAFGPRDEIIAKMTRPAPLNIVGQKA